MRSERTNQIYTPLRRTLSLTLLLALLLGLCAPVTAEDSTVYLDDAQSLLEFVRRCSYDAWSRDKTVVLQRDISLGGVSFEPAGSFGGIFEGGGHTISGLNISGSVSPAGLFAVVARGGEVRDLNVEGSVTPSGAAERIGGIAGVNRGTLSGCSFTGTVSGEKSVGGIAGENSGTLRLCTMGGGVFGKNGTGGIAGTNHGTLNACANKAYVNTNMLDPSLSIDKLDLSSANGLASMASPDVYNVAVDTGGVAGFSDGELLGCRNSGSVGYQHIGYNVGGIVGRSSGHTASCSNEGTVCGRREVGGIAGVAEPFVKYNLRESTLDSVQRELNALKNAVDRAVTDAERGGETVSARLTELNNSVVTVERRAQDLGDAAHSGVTENIDSAMNEVNRGSEILDNSITQLGGVFDELTAASGTLTKAIDALDQAAQQLNGEDPLDEVNAAAEDLKSAVWLIDHATAVMRRGAALIRLALDPSDLEAMVEEWKKQAEAAEASVAEWEKEVNEREQELANLSEQLNGPVENLDDIRRRIQAVEDTLAEWRRRVKDGTTLAQDLRRRVQEAETVLRQDGAQLREAASDLQRRQKLLSEGIDSIEEGIAILQSGRSTGNGQRDGRGLSYYLTGALDHLENASNSVRGVADTFEYAAGLTRDASDELTASLNSLDALLDYLKAQEALHFELKRTGVDTASDALFDSLYGVSDQVELLNRETKASGDVVLEDVREINRRFNSLMNTLINAVNDRTNTTTADMVKDTSDEDVDAVVEGKLLLCVNRGEISGDIDVGGIAGAMMVFDELDPEKDFKSLSDTFRRSYELKCVLQRCVNHGVITGKRDNVGSVCGNVSLGLVSACEGYGAAQSESGGSVGGVAGFSSAVVRKCWAKCSLAGERDVGGIVGAGADDLRIEGCRSLVEITRCGQYEGAILGREAGVLKNNLFVSDSLGGVNRLSTAGTAEPTEYASFAAEAGAPAEVQRFTLRFVADDRTVSTKHFHYGDSFGAEDIPALPEKEGQYARWDRTDLTELHFDTTVTAEYFPAVTALASSVNRSAERPVFFAEGTFDGDASLEAQPALYDFETKQEGVLHLLRSYRRSLQEQWALELTQDGAHTLRYLPPEGVSGRLELYLREEASEPWRLVQTGKQGSYLTFELPGSYAELSVVSAATPWWIWAQMALLLLVVVLLTVDLTIRRKEPKKAQLTEEEKKTLAAVRKKRRKHLAVQLAVLLLLSAGTMVAVRLAPRVSEGMGLYRLLRSYTERTDVDMSLTLKGKIGGRELDTEVELYAADCEGKRVSCVTWQEIPIYFCDSALVLENGKAYRSLGVLADYSQLLHHASSIYRALEVTRTESNDVKIYHAVARGEEAAQLVPALLPGMTDHLTDTDAVDLLLLVTDGELTSMKAVWTGGGDTLAAELRITATGAEHTLPQPVRATITVGGLDQAEEIGEETKRLIRVWTETAAQEPLTARVSFSADCGPLLVDESLNWQRTRRYQEELSRISRRGMTVYFTDTAICTEGGVTLERSETSFTGAARLLRLFYEAFLLGQADCEKTADGWRYTIALDEAAMSNFADMIVPEAGAQGALFTEGTVRLEIRNDALSSLSMRCRGNIKVVREEVPASLSANMSFDRDASFIDPPAEVVRALGLE